VTPLRHWLAGAPGGSSTEYAAPSPAALAPATGLALMIGTNDLLFEPLGQIGSQYVAHVLRGALVVAPAAATALALHVFPNRLQPVTTVVSASIAAFALAGLIGLGPGSALAPAAAVLALAAAGSATFWQSLSRPGRRALLALTVLGSAASLTLPARFGLGAREAVSIAPHLAERLPLVGALSLAVVLAVRGGLGWPNGHISRSAAIGGIRAA
jgi:hypothetical protein